MKVQYCSKKKRSRVRSESHRLEETDSLIQYNANRLELVLEENEAQEKQGSERNSQSHRDVR